VSTYAILDIGATTTVDAIALLATNLDVNAKWQVRAANTSGALTSSPIYDSSTIGFWPQTNLTSLTSSVSEVNGLLWLDTSAVTAKLIRIDVYNSTNSAGYIQAGRLFVSSVFQPTHNPEPGDLSFGYESPENNQKSAGGQTFVDEPWRLRQARFTLTYMSKAEAFGQALQLDSLKGTSGNLLIVIDPNESTYLHDFMFYARMDRLDPVRFIEGANFYEKTMSFEELK